MFLVITVCKCSETYVRKKFCFSPSLSLSVLERGELPHPLLSATVSFLMLPQRGDKSEIFKHSTY